MKKLLAIAMLCTSVLAHATNFISGQVLTAAELNAAFAATVQLSGSVMTGPLTVPTITAAQAVISGGTISGVTITGSTIPVTDITGTGTGVIPALQANVTGSGGIALATSPIFTTPNLGTPSAAVLTNATGLPVSSGLAGTGTGVPAALGANVTGSGGIVLATSPTITTPTISGGTATLTTPLAVSSGGTGTGTASGTALDNITGFSGTGFMSRAGAGSYSFASRINLSNLANQAANTVVANVTSGSTMPTAVAMPSCSTSSSAVNYTTNTGFGCNTSVNAATLTGNTWAAPGTIGGTTPAGATFTTLGVNTGASIANGLTVSSGGEAVTGGLLLNSTVTPFTNNNQAAATSFVAGSLACANIMFYGGNNTGSANNDTAFTNALAAPTNTANNKCVEFPPGQYNFASRAVVSLASNYQSVTLKGAGSNLTTLYWPTGLGIEVVYSGGTDTAHISGMTLATGSVNAGVGIALAGTFTSTSSAGLSTIDDITTRDVNGYFGPNNFNIGIYIDRVSGVNINNLQLIGASGTLSGTGLEITTTSAGAVPIVYNLTNSSINFYSDGFVIGPEVQGVQVANCNFTGDAIGIYVPGSESGLDQLSVVNSQFNVAAGNPNILIASAFPNLLISNNLFLINNNSSGVNYGPTSTTTITGNSFEPNTGSPTNVYGIIISGYTNGGGVITGNSFFTLTAGVDFLTGSKNFVLNSNVYQGNTSNYINNCTGCVIGTATP